jgi:lipopolysaccharide transport system permease protein
LDVETADLGRTASVAAAYVDADAAGRVTVIRPASRVPRLQIDELWHFRELLWTLVWRDVAVRYKQTFLGVAWAILVPAFTALV